MIHSDSWRWQLSEIFIFERSQLSENDSFFNESYFISHRLRRILDRFIGFTFQTGKVDKTKTEINYRKRLWTEVRLKNDLEKNGILSGKISEIDRILRIDHGLENENL